MMASKKHTFSIELSRPVSGILIAASMGTLLLLAVVLRLYEYNGTPLDALPLVFWVGLAGCGALIFVFGLALSGLLLRDHSSKQIVQMALGLAILGLVRLMFVLLGTGWTGEAIGWVTTSVAFFLVAFVLSQGILTARTNNPQSPTHNEH